MKKQLIPLVASIAMLMSCGGSTLSVSSNSAATSEEVTTSLSEESEQTTSQKTSSEQTEEKESSYTPSTSQGGEGTSSIDLDGFIAIAEAPEGVVLTDWTDEMKAIFIEYLHGVIPPFIWMENLRVTYDNLGILQVRGASFDNCAEEYAQTLENAGYAAQTVNETKCTRVYGRAIGEGFLISVDGLDQNDLFTINFAFDLALSEWPAQGIAEILNSEMYGYTQTVVPAYTSEGVDIDYYASDNGFGEIDILCLGAPETCVEEYDAILNEEHWTIATMANGAHTATSRDRRVVLYYYYDGTGLQIIIGFGEGESYATWEECIGAINDFGHVELRAEGNIADSILEIPTAELYEIDRSVRGALKITAYKHTSFKEEDRFTYMMNMVGTGNFEYKIKGDDYWLCAKDKSFAIRLVLADYVDDTLAVTTFGFEVYDYRIYEGGYVYYGVWPQAQADTIKNNINSKLAFPGYHNEEATYYVFSDYGTNFKVMIHNPGENALATYRDALDEYSYSFLTETTDALVAIDRDETAQVNAYMENEELVIELHKYIASNIKNNVAKYDFTGKSQLVSSATHESHEWVNGPFTFRVEQNTASQSVGNEGDFLYDPLRLYYGQKVIISSSANTISKLDFYVTDLSSDNREIKNFDASFLQYVTIEGATFNSYNTETGRVRFIVDENIKELTFIVDATGMKSGYGFGLTGLDIAFND
ncbi:MAG: hypothetical protein K5694_04000 [Bacilli bacterium]|nr:hypothetical protein [Bacilli bacterium]